MNLRAHGLASIVLLSLIIVGCGGGGDEEGFLELQLSDADGLLTGPPRIPELHYGDAVNVKSEMWQTFLAGYSDASVRLRHNTLPRGEWVVLDGACNCPSGKVVHFNDTVVIRSMTYGAFLSARGSGDKASVNLKAVPSTWEQFRLVDPDQTGSTAPVNWGAAATILSQQWNNYVSGRSSSEGGDVKLMVQTSSWEQWHLVPAGVALNSYWMSELSGPLRDVPLTQAVIPGSHDSGTYSIADDAPFSPDLPLENLAQLKDLLLSRPKLVPQVNQFMARFARAQNTDIGAQLETGIRYFDLRPGASNNGQGSDLLVVHSLYGGNILAMISTVGAFLETHPYEVVILDFSHFTAMNDAHHRQLIAHLKTTFGAKLAPRPPNASEDNPGANTYTFGQMRANGWQVVALYHDASAEAEPGLWRYGTPQDTKWWPDKPTTAQVNAHLQNLLVNERPLLSNGSFFVLQTVLTGDPELWAKVIVRLEAPLEDTQAKLAQMQAALVPLKSAVTNAKKKVDSLNAEIRCKQHAIDDYQDWIDDHPDIWDAAGRTWRWAAIKVLEVEKSALQSTRSGADDALAGARDALNAASAKLVELQGQIDALLAVPTSLVELASAGNPTMLGWLDGWRDQRLNIIIQDVPGIAFVNKVRALNTK